MNKSNINEIEAAMMENLLKEGFFRSSFVSLSEYENYLRGLDCGKLKEHDYSKARVPVENFQKRDVYNKVYSEKCSNKADDNKTASIEKAIQTLIKVADELDKCGLEEMSNEIDNILSNFSKYNTNCKDC